MLNYVIVVLYLFDFQGPLLSRNGFAIIGGGKRYEVNTFLTAYSNFFISEVSQHFVIQNIIVIHSWASASSLMPPAQAFRHPKSPSGTEHFGTGLGPLIPVPDWVPLFRYRTGFPYFGPRMVPLHM